MSLEFSRRSFLKYTAVAAVAVAGSSLLTGCDTDYAVTLKKIGTIDNMNVKATMSQVAYDASNKIIAFPISLENNHTTPLYPDKDTFVITIEYKVGEKTQTRVYSSVSSDGYKLTKDLTRKNGIVKGESASGYIYIHDTTDLPALATGATVTVLYHCDSAYNKFSDTWELAYNTNNFASKKITINTGADKDTLKIEAPTP